MEYGFHQLEQSHGQQLLCWNSRRGCVVVFVVMILVAACDDGAEERSKADATVGRYSDADMTITVENGAAQIQRVAGEAIVLWATAPSVDIEVVLNGDEDNAYEFEFQNIMMGATIRTTFNNRSVEMVETAPTATVRRIRLEPMMRGLLRIQVVPPVLQEESTWRFAVVNDPHSADALQSVVARLNVEDNLQMVISAGDLGASNASSCRKIKAVLSSLNVPFYSSVGNIDVGEDASAWHFAFGRHSFQFIYRDISFIFLDSASATIASGVYAELSDWLNANASFHIVVTHIPPVDPEGTRNAAFRQRSEGIYLQNQLAVANTGLLLLGHLHNYYAYTAAGIPTVVSGPSGHIEKNIEQYLVVEVNAAGRIVRTTRVW